MSIQTFLASLPAVLAILGFVIYQIIQSQGKEDSITSKIVEKLRVDLPEKFKGHEQLNSKQLFSLLEQDNSLREQISDQDFQLLQQTLKQQFQTKIIVYVICAILFVVGTVLFIIQANKPVSVAVSNISVSSTNSVAKGLAVDLDNLVVKWSSSGEPEDVRVYLENLDTQVRSNELKTLSSNGQVEFLNHQFQSVLYNRVAFEWNRVRAVIVTSNNTFYSDELKLYVGATVMALPFQNEVKIAMTVDNTSLNGYAFDALLVVWNREGNDTLSFGNRIPNGQKDYPIDNADSWDWSTAKLGYLGPDDVRLVRSEILYD